MVVASLGFASMGVFAKLASHDLPVLAVVFARTLVVALVSLSLLKIRKVPLRVNDKRLMAWRCATGFVAMIFYYYAISAVPLAVAVTLHYTVPMVVAVLAWIVLKERLSPVAIGIIPLAFVGVILILSPDFDGDVELGALAALGSAVFAALAYLAVRRLRSTDPPEMIVLAFALTALLPSAPGLLMLDRMPTPIELLMLLGVGVCASVGQVAMTHAYRHAPAAIVSTLSYSTVLFSATAGLLIFGEGISWTLAVGGLLVISAGASLVLLNRPSTNETNRRHRASSA